jgi:hypothetical protein
MTKETEVRETEVQETEKKENVNNIFTSLNLKDGRGKLLAFKAMSSPTFANDTLKNTAFEVEHIFKHTITLENEETGEMVPTERMVLINKAGETVAFVSGGAITSIDNLTMIFGPAPWSPAIPVKLEEIKTRKGRRAYNLVPVMELMDLK